MRIYTNEKIHLLFGLSIILLTIWISDAAGLWRSKISIGMTLISLIILGIAYFFIGKIPKHDDDIHIHEKDERTRVRH